MYACNGILLNHESPLRGETFVTRKITRAVTKIALGLQQSLYIGNLDAQRDLGHAKGYVEAMYLLLQQEQSEDFVIATGVTTKVREFVRCAFLELGLHLRFEGKGLEEKGILASFDVERYKEIIREESLEIQKRIGDTLIFVDPAYFRPTEVDFLIGDASKAREKLGGNQNIIWMKLYRRWHCLI